MSAVSMPPDAVGHRYPRLVRRVRAAVIDSIILIAAFFMTAMGVSTLEIHGGFKLALVAFVILALEPGLVSITGATIGHHLMGLKVQHATRKANLGIFRATVRFSVKALFGLPSLIFVLITKRHQAIHDLFAKSLVIFENPENVSDHEAIPERTIDQSDHTFASNTRKIIVIGLYSLFLSTPFEIAGNILISERCFNDNLCSSADRGYLVLLGYGLLAVLMVLGWQGLLWGYRSNNNILNDQSYFLFPSKIRRIIIIIFILYYFQYYFQFSF